MASAPLTDSEASALVESSKASPEVVAALRLHELGVREPSAVFYNLTVEQLTAHEVLNREGAWTANGVLNVDTGSFLVIR